MIRGIIEEIHPSKAILYFHKEGFIGTINFCDVQVVVLSEKNNSISFINAEGETKSNVRAIRSVLESSFLNR